MPWRAVRQRRLSVVLVVRQRTRCLVVKSLTADVFDWAAESAKALETVLSRLASFDFVTQENPLFEDHQPDIGSSSNPGVSSLQSEALSLSRGALNAGREVPRGGEYDAVAGAEAARNASRLADASQLTAESNWATAVSLGSRLRTRLNLLEQHRQQTRLAHEPGLDRSGLSSETSEALLVVTPAMLDAARRDRPPFSLYGFAASVGSSTEPCLVGERCCKAHDCFI